jgi:hypothetical protein
MSAIQNGRFKMRYYLSHKEEENDLMKFFEELKEIYVREKQDFVWKWESVTKNIANKSPAGTRDFLHWVAFNLSKNVLHGPLPDHIHARMVFEKDKWTKKYIDYLEGKLKD